MHPRLDPQFSKEETRERRRGWINTYTDKHSSSPGQCLHSHLPCVGTTQSILFSFTKGFLRHPIGPPLCAEIISTVSPGWGKQPISIHRVWWMMVASFQFRFAVGVVSRGPHYWNGLNTNLSLTRGCMQFGESCLSWSFSLPTSFSLFLHFPKENCKGKV